MNTTLAKMMDHTVLKPETTRATIEKFCSEAREHGFASVCINPCHVKYAYELLRDSGVKVCTVVGFPLGASTTDVKAFETKNAVDNGAQEIDMVINIGALKDKRYEYVLEDIEAVVKAAGKVIVKVIIETSALSDEEKVIACQLAVKAGAAFVKTSTGFGSGGATVEDVTLMKKTVGDKALIKASTGVKTREFVEELIQAGAVRFGTSSGISICSEEQD
ncbi:MAG: deoxyribose-phosphate aldolase [Clostridia bacterium]|nr:deoxyribose-phosphate aldolase [Clostridia bacterium]